VRKTTLVIAVTVLATVAVACADVGRGGGSSGSRPAIPHPTGADDLVLRVDTSGGFVPIQVGLRSIPGFSLYGDGRLVVTGPTIEIYPGPALPNLIERTVTEEGVQAVLAEAERAGLLDGDASYPYPCVADLPTTTFTVNANGQTHVTTADALGVEGSGATGASGSGPGGAAQGSAGEGSAPEPGASIPRGPSGGCQGADVDARQRLSAFDAKLGDLGSWLPEGSLGPERPYTPTELRVFVTAYRADPQLRQRPVRWPLARPLDPFGERAAAFEGRCGVLTGDEAATLLAAAREANELTPWTSDGRRFALVFRPLLPDEHTC
jgi:hypothetical protein